MPRLLFFVLLATVAAVVLARPTGIAWDASPDWPAGTTVEVCGNGDVCVSGVTATQTTLDLPISGGDLIQVRARAVALNGDSSEWAVLAQTLPATGDNLWARLDPLGDFGSGDVGAVAEVGQFRSAALLRARGRDIWSTADEFHFAWVQVSGDVRITARVASVTNVSPWAKAGVMVRENLTAGSKHAMTAITPGNGVAFQRRTTTGGTSTHTAGVAVAAPYWVRMTRAGNTFTAHQSPDGVTWTQVGTVAISMSASAYVGLALTSQTRTATVEALFTDIEILQ
jgi:regulation of enolase protein 1 (concanavalin A-like superfamily)